MPKLSTLCTTACLAVTIVILPCSYFSAYAQDSDDPGDSSYQVPALPDPMPLAKPQFPPSVATAQTAAVSPALNSTTPKIRNIAGASCTSTNPCAVNSPQTSKSD
jgi:hypothetical protein